MIVHGQKLLIYMWSGFESGKILGGYFVCIYIDDAKKIKKKVRWFLDICLGRLASRPKGDWATLKLWGDFRNNNNLITSKFKLLKGMVRSFQQYLKVTYDLFIFY